MAPARRRSTRNANANANAPKTPTPEPPATEVVASAAPTAMDTTDTTTSARPGSSESTETCPKCTPETKEQMNTSRRESWIECDCCKRWYHWRCAGNGEDVDTISKWFCDECSAQDPSRVTTFKTPARKSARKKATRDYASLNNGGVGTDPQRFMRMVESKSVKKAQFKRMKGNDLEHWLENDETALREPVIFEKPDGLGMKMPLKDLTVEDVAELVGEEVPVEVMDVATQSGSPGWDLGKWADYIALEPTKREKILNVISLEISGTPLSDMILPPKIVRDLDWVENFWPSTRKGKGHQYPKVQLYCLMGVAEAFTDWHIDFAGSSVYYHILSGAKVFYFVRPTPANLAAYEKWSGSELQNTTWFGDMVDEVVKVELAEGNTMIIPSGWIHAVYTPMDTIVFGGNFVHSYDVAMQLKIRNIEIATNVPKKFRFPMFTKLCWYVGDKYLRDIKSTSPPSCSPRVLNGMLDLAEFLVSEARTLERGPDQAKKEAKDQVPQDRVKDPSSVARELRWRVKQLLGYDSDDEGGASKRKVASPAPGSKRRRVEEDETPRLRHFVPKKWDGQVETKTEAVVIQSGAPAPRTDESWTEDWLSTEAKPDGVGATVTMHRETLVRVRRTAKGLERHRIERQLEEWQWDE